MARGPRRGDGGSAAECVFAHEAGVALTVAGACQLDDSVVEHAKVGIVASEGASLHA